jgi:hypothetical protein
MSKGEKKCGKEATMVCFVACSTGRVEVQEESAECSSSSSRLPSMPKGEIVGILTNIRKHVHVFH